MTVLPDWEIRHRCVELHGLVDRVFPPLIENFQEDQLQPSSYDVKLDWDILVPVMGHIPIDIREPANPNRFRKVVIVDSGYLLTQGRFVLGSTKEWVNIHTDLVGRIEGKSSRARQGLQIHCAGYLDPGFCGNVTLEIVNFSPDPIVLWPDILIAQLSFEKMTDHCEVAYGKRNNHYQNSKGVVASRIGITDVGTTPTK